MKFNTSTEMFRMISRSILAVAVLLTIAASAPAADFDRDGKADFAVFRPSTSTWLSGSSKGDNAELQWGRGTDVLVPADYDNDDRTDFAVWRPENGVWYIHQSADDSVLLVRWGMAATRTTAFVPVPADYDHDGETDLGLWNSETGEWCIARSSNGYDQNNAIKFRWGKTGDVPVQADYDGDRIADFAAFRPSGNRWYIRESSTGKTSIKTFGLDGLDKLVPADYTGDKNADMAVYLTGVWFV